MVRATPFALLSGKCFVKAKEVGTSTESKKKDQGKKGLYVLTRKLLGVYDTGKENANAALIKLVSAVGY